MFISRLFCAALAALGVVHAAAPQDLAASVKSVSFPMPGRERVRLVVQLELTASKALTVRKIIFHGVKINGLPAFVPGMIGPIGFKAGAPVARSVMVTAYYRDLQTIEPLIDAIE